MIDNVANRADRLFPEKGVIPSNSPVYTEFNLQDLVEERKADAVGRMLYIEAETQTCRISLGSVVDILFPEAMDVPALGKYRIRPQTCCHFLKNSARSPGVSRLRKCSARARSVPSREAMRG